MHVVLTPSPSITHKYRVILPSKRAVDFGQKGYQHYTDHNNPRLMRAHLLRKGAIMPKELRIETNQMTIHRGMLSVDESTKEDWEDFLGLNIGNDGYFGHIQMSIRLNCS